MTRQRPPYLRVRGIILGAVALVALLFILKSAADAVYFNRRQALIEEIGGHQTRLASIRDARRDHITIRADLQNIADRTLGDSLERVEAELRARLNRITESIGLAGATVSTGQANAVRSPAERRINRGNPLRKTADFVEVDASVVAEGSLEQVMRLVHRIESEPWIKRINSVDLSPREGGERFKTTVRLKTLFLPQVPPQPGALDDVYESVGFERYLAFAQSNPFHLPPPPPAVAQQPQQEPGPAPAAPEPPRFPYGQWALTMVTESSRGQEAWLINRQTQERLTLAPGEKISELEFIAASEDEAEFRLGEKRFVIAVGSALNERTPVRERASGDSRD